MKYKLFRLLSLMVILGLTASACAPKSTEVVVTPAPTSSASPSDQPFQVTGTYSVTNGFVLETYIVENAVALIDMHGFVIRDREWELPVKSQVLGFMTFDSKTLSGTFDLDLPVQPEGEFNDVDHNGKEDQGVQIFAVSYSPNLTGGPFSEGDDRTFGWPSYLASVKTNSENDDEVIGGSLVVWAPDADQQFPTGFGDDGLLFTDDDPVSAIPAGYSLVNMDHDPFVFSQTPTFEMTLLEPKEFELKDFSNQSYTEAFDNMFEFIKINYAFNGIEGKQPDWDKLYSELKPRVEKAEADKDAKAFYLALWDYTLAFKDGHVGLGGGDSAQQYRDEDFSANTDGGLGFAIRELDDGRELVMYILKDGPAEKAGMKLGAELTEFNGKPVAEAIGEVVPRWVMPVSSGFSLRYQQVRYLLRSPVGTDATITFVNPDEAPKIVTLTSIAERDSFARTSVYFGVDTNHLLPVEYKVITQGNATIGYVSINSYYDDLNLIIRLFERALKQFSDLGVNGIIIDMRYNGGGNPLGLAGFLYDQEIPLGQGESFSETTGKFEPEGLRDKVLPNGNQYSFEKMVLLVSPQCASACDQEAYAFSQVPGMIVVGEFPTSGTFADVAKGQFSLPDGISLQVPTTRFTLPDGSLFLEGTGVAPTLKVPTDETTVFSEEDVVLQAGIKAVLEPLGAGITPSAQPKLMSADETESGLSALTQLEEKAQEKYTDADSLDVNKTFTYTIPLAKSEDLLWAWVWCAKDAATVKDNVSKMVVKFTLNGEEVPLDQLLKLDFPNSGQQCTAYLVGVTEWTAGEHHLVTTLTFKSKLNDGTYDFAPGTQTFNYNVYVKP